MMQYLRQIIGNNKLLTLIIVIGFAVRFIGLIPNIAHTDEAYTVEQSRQLFYNIITRFDFDPHAYKYGSLIFYLQTLVYLPFYLVAQVLITFGFAQPPPVSGIPIVDAIEQMTDYFSSLVFAGGRSITAIFGGLSVLLVYIIGKKLFTHWTAIVAALVLAINPVHVRDSRYITADVPLVFFILLALVFMINLSSSRWRWYLLAGLAIGVSSTIKYFPLALLAYPIAVLRDNKKDKIWLVKILAGLLAIPIGVFIGAPFLFINPESRVVFQEDMQAQFLWYGTSITVFVSSLVSYIFSLGRTEVVSPSILVPTEFTEFHSSFLFFKALGPILAVCSLLGIFVALLKFPGKALFLLVIPLVNFIYISFYLGAVYERTSLPILPFAGIFAAVFLVSFKDFFLGWIKNRRVFFFYALLFVIVFYYPTTATFTASLSCSKDSADQQALDWIAQTVLEGKKIAQVAPLSLPINRYEVREIRPDTEFFLHELQDLEFDYVFVNTSFLERLTYQFENNFFVIPEVLYQNYYVPLALKEYDSRANLLKKFARHHMCDPSQFLYYEIPQKLMPATNSTYKFTFEDNSEVDFWCIEMIDHEGSKVSVSLSGEGHAGDGSLKYNWSNIYYRGPRVISEKIPVIPSQNYTFTGWVKSESFLEENERDAFLRIDFYSDDQANTLLPGEAVALSHRLYGKPEWQNLTVTAQAPPDSKFATLSLNVVGTKNIGSFYFDDLEFSGP